MMNGGRLFTPQITSEGSYQTKSYVYPLWKRTNYFW